MNTAEKMNFSFKDFLSKCDQIRCFPRIRSHLLKKTLMENVIFVQWNTAQNVNAFKTLVMNDVIKCLLF